MFCPDKSVTVMKDGDDWIKVSNFSYVRVHKRRRVNDIDGDFRM